MTGSGKTQSVIYPLMMQDIKRGKAVVFLDAKGSASNMKAFLSMAGAAGRIDDVKIFSLSYPKSSHSFNPVYPLISSPQAVAEVVFSSFEKSQPYYSEQGLRHFEDLIRACHATGKPFSLGDVAAAVLHPAARDELLWQVRKGPNGTSEDVEELLLDINSHVQSLGKTFDGTFTGLVLNLRKLGNPLLNSYNSDIRLLEDVESRKLLYFQLPINDFKFLAPAVGKTVLQLLQAVGSKRQTGLSDMSPVAIFIDEFYAFAYDEFITALNMLRDANFQILLAHQSMSDLERVSKEFARGVQNNTRLKIVLAQQDSALAEEMSKSLGTIEVMERTYKEEEGALLTRVSTGGASNRKVDQFILHPNQIKHLAPAGQAYVINGSNAYPVCLPLFPMPDFDLEGVRFSREKNIEGLNLRRRLLGRSMD